MPRLVRWRGVWDPGRVYPVDRRWAWVLVLAGCVADPTAARDLAIDQPSSLADLVAPATPDLMPVPEGDCLDGLDDNGDGKVDCADPSCDSRVECVDAPTGAEPLGVVVDALAACPPGYTRSQPLRQGLTSTSCTGCGCDVRTTCVYQMTLYGAAGCSGSPLLPKFAANAADWDNDATNCSWISTPKVSIGSVKLEFDHLLEAVCDGAGSATRLPLQWGVDHSFCVATTGGGCDAQRRCVQKRAATMCLLSPVGEACGGSYPTNLDVHYGGVNDPRTCAACDDACSVSAPGQCPTTHYPGYLVGNDDGVCVASGHEVGMPISASTGLMCVNAAGWSAINTLHFETVAGSYGGVCVIDPAATGTAVATDPIRVCCAD